MKRKPRKAIKRRQRGPGLDDKISAAPTYRQKRRLARTGQAEVPTGLQAFVRGWALLRRLRARLPHPEARAMLATLAPELEQQAARYIVHALAHDDDAALEKLALAVREERRAPTWCADETRLAILLAEEHGLGIAGAAKLLEKPGAEVDKPNLRKLRRRMGEG
jgi:hypothetical protein